MRLGASVRQLSTVALFAAACGVLSPEEQLLTRFFEASRLNDTTTVSTMSGVVFNPRTDGVIRQFDVAEVRDDGDSKRVTVRAAVRQWDGGTIDRTLVFTLARRDGRWFISRFE